MSEVSGHNNVTLICFVLITHTHTHTNTHTHTQGYVKRCKGYNKLFDDDKCDTIFSNVEQIYSFQKDFLRELETSVEHYRMEDSKIGEVFVTNVSPLQ